MPELLLHHSQVVVPTAVVNKNGRTLRGFSTGAQDKMWEASDSCPGCPYEHFSQFYEYYGDFDYGDKCDPARRRPLRPASPRALTTRASSRS